MKFIDDDAAAAAAAAIATNVDDGTDVDEMSEREAEKK